MTDFEVGSLVCRWSPDGEHVAYMVEGELIQDRYGVRCLPQFEPGFEAYGELGEVSDFLPSDEQDHRIGPVIFGALPITPTTKIQYELGYLFGLTDGSPDGTLRWQLEYEFLP